MVANVVDHEGLRIARLGQRGVRKAIERMHSKGLPVVVEMNDKPAWLWPDGVITVTDTRPEYYPIPAADYDVTMVAENVSPVYIA